FFFFVVVWVFFFFFFFFVFLLGGCFFFFFFFSRRRFGDGQCPGVAESGAAPLPAARTTRRSSRPEPASADEVPDWRSASSPTPWPDEPRTDAPTRSR
ncbi:MAG: hypothetical protein EAS51_08100, partial [Microbacteriaceae bacterium]